MGLSQDAKQLIDQKKYEDVEARWMARLEDDPAAGVDEFIETARMLRKADERARADALLGLLGDALRDRAAWPQRLRVLKEVARLARNPQNLRKDIEEALLKTYASRPSLQKVLGTVNFNEANSNPVEKAEKVENALNYDVGECFFMAGRGAGVVKELNAELGVCRLDFENDKRVSVPLGAAQKFLLPLPPGHLLREKIEKPEALQAEAAKDPAGTFARLLQSFGRAMNVSEVKDAMTGIVPEKKWSSWWTAARKNPQIIASGTGTKATYAWSSSSAAAGESVKKDFASANPRTKLDLARKHSARSQELADFFSSTLAREAASLARTDPAFAWEILTVLEKLPGKYSSEVDAAALLSGPMASRVVTAIQDRTLRERALTIVREKHPDWAKVYSEVFFTDEDPRILSLIIDALDGAGEKEIRDRLIDETLRYPRRHPRAFYWYTKLANESETLPERVGYPIVFQVIDAIGSDEFSSVKARLREFFDKGALAIRIIQSTDNEEQARKLLDMIDRMAAIEEYRRDIVRTAIHMKHPHVREPQAEPLYATPEALERKKAELEHLRKVEIPENSRELANARAEGDLRENFEYKARRARAEYLSARAAELSGELSRVRVLNLEEIDTTVIRVGTKVQLSNGDMRREVTILGPWESDPERGVYSHQSEAAKALLGKSAGEIVSFMGNDYMIEGVSRWK